MSFEDLFNNYSNKLHQRIVGIFHLTNCFAPGLINTSDFYLGSLKFTLGYCSKGLSSSNVIVVKLGIDHHSSNRWLNENILISKNASITSSVHSFIPVLVKTFNSIPIPVCKFISVSLYLSKPSPVADSVTPVVVTKSTSGLSKDKLNKRYYYQQFDATISLHVFDLDTLTAMGITRWIKRKMNIEFSRYQSVGDNITIEDLINIIIFIFISDTQFVFYLCFITSF
ncbi:hypothetical protein H8356DRAFT_1332888 [Neocallimastix lanati (nom. inval.)]|nr:hypothetical protein H8356DRAFT_1332888 [Neocallimastix sp. JGI-2020a]